MDSRNDDVKKNEMLSVNAVSFWLFIHKCECVCDDFNASNFINVYFKLNQNDATDKKIYIY